MFCVLNPEKNLTPIACTFAHLIFHCSHVYVFWWWGGAQLCRSAVSKNTVVKIVWRRVVILICLFLFLPVCLFLLVLLCSCPFCTLFCILCSSLNMRWVQHGLGCWVCQRMAWVELGHTDVTLPIVLSSSDCLLMSVVGWRCSTNCMHFSQLWPVTEGLFICSNWGSSSWTIELTITLFDLKKLETSLYRMV